MDGATLDTIRAWFAAFSDSYVGAEGVLHPMLQLKRNHSERVANECRDIASELGWPNSDINTAEALGLLHDVGRYPQFQKFKTFFDPKSLNHGECGYGVLNEAHSLDACPPGVRASILDGVRAHNRRTIPDDLAPLSIPFVKLIRDADKLDIIYIVNDTIRRRAFDEHPEILLNIDPDGPLNPDLVHEIRQTKSGSYQSIKSLVDMCLMRVAWVYDINYAPSLRRLKERGLLDDLYERLPMTPEICDLLSDAEAHILRKLSAP